MLDPIAYSFLLYVLYVLVPIIPAVVIFKMFPDTRVAVSGPLQHLTVRATGAFAAYIVTVVLGYGLAQSAAHQIELAQTASWNVSVPVKFLDAQGNPLTSDPATETVVVYSEPKFYLLGSHQLYITVPRNDFGAWPILSVHVSGFDPGTLDMNVAEAKDSKSVVFDRLKRKVAVKDAVTLTALAPHYTANPYIESQPLKAAPGPAAPRQ